jgi:DNA segregation ATPase FtsK/SpoIIIE, S-DNA-T family
MLKRNFLSRVLKDMVSLVTDARHWTLPDVSKLPDPSPDEASKEIGYMAPVLPEELIRVLSHYGINGEFSDYHIGSAVTTYEVRVPVGTFLSAISRHREDLARDLGTPSLRIVKGTKDALTIGFEIENKDRYPVHFKALYKGLPETLRLPMILGEDTYGVPIYQDLTAMPHLLVAGQTGSGKSVFLNALITTLICKKTPEEVRFLIVDPKQVEFAAYKDIPHMYEEDGEPLAIASDPEDARHLLDIAVNEMERRFEILMGAGVKKIEDYNATAKEKLPYIVFIVDEFTDLIMMGTSRGDREILSTKIARLAQKARAAGIHMVLSTQKPDARVMSTLIKGNIPARIAFSVTSNTDSRVILDECGAESLTGGGDMLFRDPSARSEHTRLRRIQAAWLSDRDLATLLNQGR